MPKLLMLGYGEPLFQLTFVISIILENSVSDSRKNGRFTASKGLNHSGGRPPLGGR